jgi:hypothetical protein
MDRRDFLKIVGIAPAVVALPKTAKSEDVVQDIAEKSPVEIPRSLGVNYTFKSTGTITRNSIADKPEGIYINNEHFGSVGSNYENRLDCHLEDITTWNATDGIRDLIPAGVPCAELVFHLDRHDLELDRIFACSESCQVDVVVGTHVHYEFIAYIYNVDALVG